MIGWHGPMGPRMDNIFSVTTSFSVRKLTDEWSLADAPALYAQPQWPHMGRCAPGLGGPPHPQGGGGGGQSLQTRHTRDQACPYDWKKQQKPPASGTLEPPWSTSQRVTAVGHRTPLQWECCGTGLQLSAERPGGHQHAPPPPRPSPVHGHSAAQAVVITSISCPCTLSNTMAWVWHQTVG